MGSCPAARVYRKHLRRNGLRRERPREGRRRPTRLTTTHRGSRAPSSDFRGEPKSKNQNIGLTKTAWCFNLSEKRILQRGASFSPDANGFGSVGSNQQAQAGAKMLKSHLWLVWGGMFVWAVPVQGDSLSVEEANRFRDLDSRPLHTFDNADLADYIELRSRASPGNPIPQRIGVIACKALGHQRLGDRECNGTGRTLGSAVGPHRTNRWLELHQAGLLMQ